MADNTKTTSPKPRRWLRRIGIVFGVLILLLVVAYFVGTSEWALKSVILPRASKAINGNVTVESASISPFSAVHLRGLKVETKGAEPLMTAQEVRARYSLMDIIKGNINVSEVMIESPVINLVTFPDGTTNLDPLTQEKADKPKDKKKDEDKKPGEPPQINLQKFVLNNATVRKVTQRKDGTRELLELTGVNVTADDIANGKTGQAGLAANVRMDQGLNTSSNGVLAANVGGKFNFTLDQALKPQVVKGETRVEVSEGKGSFAQVAGLGVVLNADVTPTQLNDVSVRFAQQGKSLGAITASGPFSAETMEGKLLVAVSQIDRQVLNLAGTAAGIDFNQTAINSTNTIELTQKGRVINVNGALMVGNFSVTQKGQSTPVLNLRTAYAVTYDQTNKTALIQQFALNGTQNNAEFLRGTLAKPMLLEMGKGSNAVDESAFDLVVTNFNLPDWQAFIGTNATVSSGKLGLTLNLVSKQAGRNLALNLAAQLRQLSAVAGSNRIENADLTFDTRGTVADFSAVNLEQYRAELARGGQRALLASGALQYNTKSQAADVQANLETVLPQVTSLVSVPGLNLTAGTVKFAGRIQQANSGDANAPVVNRTVVGKLNVDELTGAFQSNRFDRFATAMDLDVAMRGDAVDIKKCSGTLQQSGQAGGSFDVAGNYHLSNQAGQITAKLTDLNQHALKSFLAAALGDKQLESVTINATTVAKLSGPEDRDIKAELHVANLVVNDPSGQVPKTPLAVDAVADVGQAKGVIDLRKVQLALTKTERAPNSVDVAGRLDLSKSNAWTGNLKVTSEGLDVTTYYDLFAKKAPEQSAEGTRRTTTTTPAPAPQPSPEVEPEPVKLPFTQFAADVNIAKFFLREVAISNLVTKATIEGPRANVNPVSLTLNGAPVSMTALMNLGVPGWEYDVKAKMEGVPVEPLANTFVPEQRGLYKGALFAGADIKGAGITGRSLQKNLNSQIGFTLTNAEIRYADARFDNKYLGWLVKGIGPALRKLKVAELAESPISLVDSRMDVTNGTATLHRAFLESAAFQANVQGTITLRPKLTNSTLNNLPLQLSLSRNIAEKARLAPKSTNQVGFFAVPSFMSIKGTVGKPEYDYNETAIFQILAGTAANIGVGGDAGRILRGIGNLGGQGQTTTNQAAGTTNAPSTNKPASILDALPGLLQKQSTTTNAPADTNAPAPKKKGFNLNDLLK